MRSSSGRNAAVGPRVLHVHEPGHVVGHLDPGEPLGARPVAGSRTSTARLSESPLMYGNGCAGSTASGVSTGKTWARKYSASRLRSAVVELVPAQRPGCPAPASAGSTSSCRSSAGVPGDELVGALRRPGSSVSRAVSPSAERIAEAHVQPPLQAGDPDHVELVEVAGEDREELHPLQQRQPASSSAWASTRALKSSQDSSRLENRSSGRSGTGRRPARRSAAGLPVGAAPCADRRRAGERRTRSPAMTPPQGERGQDVPRSAVCGPDAERQLGGGRRSAAVSTSWRSAGQSPDSSTAPAARCAAAEPGPNAGCAAPAGRAASSVVPVPSASATNAARRARPPRPAPRPARPAAAPAGRPTAARRRRRGPPRRGRRRRARAPG